MSDQWQTGKPLEPGYYLAAYRIHPNHPPTVSELWFNSGDGRGGTWWAQRGYLEGFGDRSSFSTRPVETVTHWMPMPKPPLEAWKQQ